MLYLSHPHLHSVYNSVAKSSISFKIHQDSMSLDAPPPLANFSFPLPGSNLQFNYLDCFWTSWTTPALSMESCLLSLYFYDTWNTSAGWKMSEYQRISTLLRFLHHTSTTNIHRICTPPIDVSEKRRRSHRSCRQRKPYFVDK